MPEGHELAEKSAFSIRDLMHFPFAGVAPDDPYGRKLPQPFVDPELTQRHAMRGGFAQTIVSLFRHGLGVAAIGEFWVSEVYMPGLVRRPLVEPSSITA
ncbi:LysR substrate-binding domain-containing protein [Paracoccus sp. R86501]|uniref:LysR substrate-binding domain-containing protein n=1 Tax=Paracoccus sp. R86501 TaxID=3101711 RepID=UPI00366DB78B